MSFQAIRAVLLASATAASLGGFRCDDCEPARAKVLSVRAGPVGSERLHQRPMLLRKRLVTGTGDGAHLGPCRQWSDPWASIRSRLRSRDPSGRHWVGGSSSPADTAPIGPIVGTRHEPAAEFVAAMPRHQPRVDLLDLLLEPLPVPGRARQTGPSQARALSHRPQCARAAARSCRAPWRQSARTLQHGRGSRWSACVRRRIKPSRVPTSIWAACCSALFTGTSRF